MTVTVQRPLIDEILDRTFFRISVRVGTRGRIVEREVFALHLTEAIERTGTNKKHITAVLMQVDDEWFPMPSIGLSEVA